MRQACVAESVWTGLQSIIMTIITIKVWPTVYFSLSSYEKKKVVQLQFYIWCLSRLPLYLSSVFSSSLFGEVSSLQVHKMLFNVFVSLDRRCVLRRMPRWVEPVWTSAASPQRWLTESEPSHCDYLCDWKHLTVIENLLRYQYFSVPVVPFICWSLTSVWWTKSLRTSSD